MKSAAMHIRGAFAVILAVAIVGAPPLARAQGKPNFSGVWKGIQESHPRDEPGAPSVYQRWAQGQPVTITQNESTITVAYVSTGRSHNRVLLTYNLDGSETKNPDLYGPWVPNPVFTAAWDGGSLVLINVFHAPGRVPGSTGDPVRYEYRDRLTLESATTFRLESSVESQGIKVTHVARFQRIGSPRP